MKKTIHLYCGTGGSDKVYQITLEQTRLGFAVNTRYGPRGGCQTEGTKTPSPVSREAAEKIFGKLLSEKTAKGYTIMETTASDPAGLTITASPCSGASVTAANCVATVNTPLNLAPTARRENVGAGHACLPQLLNEIDAEAAGRFISDDRYCLQQKHDGHRLMVIRDGADVHAGNKQGLAKAIPEAVRRALLGIPAADHFILDGELVGDVLHVFDLLELHWRGSAVPGVIDLRGDGYADRLTSLFALLPMPVVCPPALDPVFTWFGTAAKQEALTLAVNSSWEGVVFKRLAARYAPGRPEHGGDQFKYKFWKSCSAIVTARNARRSVAVHLLRDGQPVNAGNVTIPPNKAIPKPGDIIEIKFLYAFRESGILYQPIYQGPRDDVAAAECTTTQLQYKAELC